MNHSTQYLETIESNYRLLFPLIHLSQEDYCGRFNLVDFSKKLLIAMQWLIITFYTCLQCTVDKFDIDR